MQIETRNLPCKLSPQELTERSERMAEIVRQRVTLEEEKKSNAALLKMQIDDAGQRIIELAEIVTTRREYRDVEILGQRNLDRQTMDLVRADTGEVIDSRPLSPAELQDELPLRHRADPDDEAEDAKH